VTSTLSQRHPGAVVAPTAQDWRRRPWTAAVVLGAWLVVVVLAGESVLHVAHHATTSWMVALVAATPWIYLPAWVSAAVGAVFRRRLLLAASLALVALQLWWVVPAFDPISHASPPPPGAVPLRILDFNVSQANRNLSEFAREIEADGPQLVAVEELTPPALHSLQATGVLARFRYHEVSAQWGAEGTALWSTLPVRDLRLWYAVGHSELEGWVAAGPNQWVRLEVVHTDAPVGQNQPMLWQAELAAITRHLAHQARPLVVVGDLNATTFNWQMEPLLHLGLRDVAQMAGQGWRMTWPRDQHLVIPYLRIDHVLVSAGVGVSHYSLGQGQGSDHHPMWTVLWVAKA
jgi:endonuclease/exonuclease/phosphatase (EEP) superfamily protein YafD